MKDKKRFEREKQQVDAAFLRLKSYKKVAEYFGKSTWWVQGRRNKRCAIYPRDELDNFIKKVVQHLQENGYDQLKRKDPTLYSWPKLRECLIFKKSKTVFFCEVRLSINWKFFCDAIGMLMFYRLAFGSEYSERNSLLLICPNVYKGTRYFSQDILDYIRKLNIQVIFV